MLENVPNLLRHQNGETWKRMQRQLEKCGYEIDAKLLSPHQFGIPQIRERMFIVGTRGSLRNFTWPKPLNRKLSIRSVLDVKPRDAKPLQEHVDLAIDIWQDFLDRSPADLELPSFPFWTMEFGADYPFEKETPYSAGPRRLIKYRGEFGVPLRRFSPSERISNLPNYAQTEARVFPDWKIDFIKKNRQFFAEHRKWIRPWLKTVKPLQTSHQKFEWNCKGEAKDLSQFVLQFRASGLRTKRPETAPSLIAMSSTQVPVITWERRYITPRECSRLQSLGRLRYLPETQSAACRALGNAVNAKIVRLIAESLIRRQSSKHRSAA
jgi:DNA (cytosine-5)-methyltransferase 1